MDHRARKFVNETVNRRVAQPGYLFEEAGTPTQGCANEPQDMRVWVGIVLVAVGSDKQLNNGLRYQPITLPGEETGFVVQNIDDKGVLTGEIYNMDAKRFADTLRLTHAICYFSTQARTISGPLRLSQTTHKHFTIRHLIVGCGRAPEGSVVMVE